MQPLPPRLIEVGVAAAGAVGVLILIAPNFGLKPKATADGWHFPVKPTCHLLYYLTLICGITAVAFCAYRLLAFGTSNFLLWGGFAFGFLLVPVVLADWPEPLILDRQGLLEAGCAASRIRWQDLELVREYRMRWDRGLVIHGADGKQLVVAAIAYDAQAVLNCLMEWRPVPYHSVQDEIRTLSTLSHR
jgi:hypothetical protein